MFSEDYLLRIIRQYTAAFARIIGLKLAGDYQEALREIGQNLEVLLGLDTSLLELMDDESLYRLLSVNMQMDIERLGCIADLFKEKGEILGYQGNRSESDNCYIRSLSFYLLMSLNQDPALSIDEVSKKISEIIHKVRNEVIPAKTLFDLFSYFENDGEYAKAETILTDLASRPEVGKDANIELMLFYTRLLEKDEKEITAAGMNRQIIQDKLKDLN
jgi:hypothetical protein